MFDWNVVVSLRGTGSFKAARRYLKSVARVDTTDYYNVLALKADDLELFLEAVKRDVALNPELGPALARVVPVSRTFVFQNPAEFEAQARQTAATFAPQLAGTAFYVRMHRRGFRGTLVSPEQERALDRLLAGYLAAVGTPGTVRFDDPDAVLVIETLGQWAGFGLITRALRERYPFVNPE